MHAPPGRDRIGVPRVKRRSVVATSLYLAPPNAAAAKPGDHPKLDRVLNDRAARAGSGKSRVIVTLRPGADVSGDIKKVGGKLGRRLGLINGQVVELSNGQLKKLADSPAVDSIHWDRPAKGAMNRVAVTVGARAVQANFGYNGAGVGVAVIDSGIVPWHDDFTYYGADPNVRVVGGQRVSAFVDFVNGRTTPYDDFGHGTHVSGIIAGNGFDSLGVRAGIAPAADIISEKVLDGNGNGVISNVIAALDWAVQNKAAYNIRVINLSVGAPITESYNTDPLTLACKRVVDSGIVVVAAAGNFGRSKAGKTIYGSITAPGNAPWVLTVGAYSHNGSAGQAAGHPGGAVGDVAVRRWQVGPPAALGGGRHDVHPVRKRLQVHVDGPAERRSAARSTRWTRRISWRVRRPRRTSRI